MPILCIPTKPWKGHSFKSNTIFNKFRKFMNIPHVLRKRLKEYGISVTNDSIQNQNNQNNESDLSYNFQARDSIFPTCSTPYMSTDISLLYCKEDNNLDNLYQIAFKTCNVKINPFHIETRNVPDFDNDKYTQSHNKIKYLEEFNFKSGIFWTTKRIYILLKKSIKKGYGSSLNKTYPIKAYRSDEALEKSEMKREKLKLGESKTFPKPKGELHLSYNEMIFHIQTNILLLESTRNKYVDCKTHRKSFVEGLMHSNHATIVAKYKEDILQISFDICTPTIQQIILKKDKACQITDKNTYIPYTSVITNRFVRIPLALSNLFYVDPMIRWRYLNHSNALKHINPHWMRQVRKKRLKREICEDLTSEDIRSQKKTSLIYVESGGVVFKVKGGIVDVDSIINLVKYESFVVDCQKKASAENWRKIRRFHGKECVISDWNMVKYNF